MSALLAGALISGGSQLLQGVIGGIGASRANKKFNQLMRNRPEYEIPEEYQNILSRYKTAYASNMPGYEQTLSNIGQLGARTRGAAERGAISSSAYQSSVGDIYQKELDALQNLGIQQAQYKQGQLANISQAEGALAGQKSEQWNINKFLPWQTEANRYGEQRKTGMENIFAGMQGIKDTAMNFLGTRYYTDILKGVDRDALRQEKREERNWLKQNKA